MTQTLSQLSQALADTVESAGAHVLRVEGRRRLAASGVTWAPDGIIVTANHALRSDSPKVGLPSGDTVQASVVGRDPSTDLAVLRVEGVHLPSPSWSDTADLKVGHIVLALGRPGESVRATMGIVSSFGSNGHSRRRRRHNHNYVQTDLVMYPGFSGGPLVEVSGSILGINSSGLVRGASAAIPTPTIRQVVDSLLAHGRIRRGYLGVGVQPARLPAAIADQLDQEVGLLLVSVEPGSPAEKAGLVLGDTIVSIDGDPIDTIDGLLSRLGGDRIGAEASIKILRGGQLQELNVLLGERENGE